MAQNTSNPPQECSNCPSLKKGVFCSLEDGPLKKLSQHKVSNTYKKGQTLFIEGHPSFGVHCVSTGSVKLIKTNPNGEETIVRLARPGDVLGHRSVFCDEPYQATAQVLEESHICFVDKSFLKSLVKDNPDFALKLLSRMGETLGSSESKLLSFHHSNVRERVAEFLLFLSRTHGSPEPLERGGPTACKINLHLTREEMASYVGTVTETLIRTLSEFKEDKIIDLKGKTLWLLKEQELLERAGSV